MQKILPLIASFFAACPPGIWAAPPSSPVFDAFYSHCIEPLRTQAAFSVPRDWARVSDEVAEQIQPDEPIDFKTYVKQASDYLLILHQGITLVEAEDSPHLGTTLRTCRVLADGNIDAEETQAALEDWTGSSAAPRARRTTDDWKFEAWATDAQYRTGKWRFEKNRYVTILTPGYYGLKSFEYIHVLLQTRRDEQPGHIIQLDYYMRES
jgi:hypothetical protein